MSNKAQVIFTFEQQSRTTTPAQGGGKCDGFSCRPGGDV